MGELGGGVLRLIQGPEGVDFQLALWRGAPTHDMGFLEERQQVVGGESTFVQRDGDHECRIEFRFRGDTASLRPVQGSAAACGFGHAVYDDGTFRRTRRERPAFRRPPE